MAEQLRRGLWPVTEQTRVTTAELFFDLVFVFAFLHVTTLMITEGGGWGLLHGLLVLSLLWWSWSLLAWLSNRIWGGYGLARLALLMATPVMFILAVTTRETFEDVPGGGYGPIWFVAGFFSVRLLYVALRIYASPPLRMRGVVLVTVPPLLATGLLLGAALLPLTTLAPDRTRLAQVVLWLLAIAVDYSLSMVLPIPHRVILSTRHWVERHSLIIIVALGEVLVAVGVAGSDLAVSPGLLWASVFAVVVAGALEWIYFDLSALVAEHSLRVADPARRVTLARDCYSYLHLPMIIGIILLAFGLKHMPSLVEDVRSYGRGDPLNRSGRYAMYGGVALFLLAHAAFQWLLSRTARIVVWPRLTAAALLLALLPVTARVSALRTLAWLAGVCTITAIVEFLVSRAQRKELRRLVPTNPQERLETRRPGISASDQ